MGLLHIYFSNIVNWTFFFLKSSCLVEPQAAGSWTSPEGDLQYRPWVETWVEHKAVLHPQITWSLGCLHKQLWNSLPWSLATFRDKAGATEPEEPFFFSRGCSRLQTAANYWVLTELSTEEELMLLRPMYSLCGRHCALLPRTQLNSETLFPFAFGMAVGRLASDINVLNPPLCWSWVLSPLLPLALCLTHI